MGGIYIHIPFCKQACNYCNFHFTTSLLNKEKMVEALTKEIEIRFLQQQEDPELAILSKNEVIDTIYFGGGTPSLLTPKEISKILNTIHHFYKINKIVEITLEANPDDINRQQLQQWNSVGINRLSIGIQSFRESDLVWMNRAHNAPQALQCIQLTREAGFNNFSIDLIFGIPGLDENAWEQNIQTVIDLKVPHVAAYALTVEPKTPLHKMIVLNKKENINTDEQADQFGKLMKMMKQCGYEHYEISNFAMPGYRSRHNSSYWKGEKYLGIGPSAHSYNGKIRSWNVANNSIYINSIFQNKIPFEKEILTPTTKLNEYIMTSLRTIEGMSLAFIEEKFSILEKERLLHILKADVNKEYFILKNDAVLLTNNGKLFADAIAVKLFL